MKSKILLLILLVFVIVVSGCFKPPGTGNLVLQITDKPGLSVEKADVTISKIQVHMAEAGNESNESEAGWITVVEEAKTFDLVAIKNVTEFLGEKELTAGRYTQIRLNVDRALVTINGTEYNLTIPSKTVKLVKSFEIVENKTTTLILDFDAEKSVHEAGKDNYIMKPTIMVIELVELSEEQACIDSGGTVMTSSCCLQTKDFPNLCLVGPCACSPENSHEVKICDCGEDRCFNGKKCVEIG